MPNLPSFWVTAIAKSLSGDSPCQLSTWLAGRNKFPKRPGREGEMAIWRAKHSEMLASTVEQFRNDGWKCDVERFFRVEGHSAIISGKADIVCQRKDSRPTIVDVKSGQPRDSDISQVICEMCLVPLAWQVDMTFAGLVVYQGATVPIQAAEAVTMRPKLFALLKQLGTMERPGASPSRDACRFCDVPVSECPDRYKTEDSVSTDLF